MKSLKNLSIKARFRQMALTPKIQFKKLIIGTIGAFVCMLTLIFTSSLENVYLFYFLSFILVLCITYAVPGYIGIWVWRMRKSLFNID